LNSPIPIRQFPLVLQSRDTHGYTFFRRINADGRSEKKLLGQEWEPSDTPTIRLDRLEKYLFTMTQRLGWTLTEGGAS
jgi:hypothetical protein